MISAKKRFSINIMLDWAGFVDEGPHPVLEKGFYMNILISRCSHLRPSFWQEWYAIPLRLIIAWRFVAQSCAKLARGPGAFSQILHVPGMPDPPSCYTASGPPSWHSLPENLIGQRGLLSLSHKLFLSANSK
jgi:hypothetical protein